MQALAIASRYLRIVCCCRGAGGRRAPPPRSLTVNGRSAPHGCSADRVNACRHACLGGSPDRLCDALARYESLSSFDVPDFAGPHAEMMPTPVGSAIDGSTTARFSRGRSRTPKSVAARRHCTSKPDTPSARRRDPFPRARQMNRRRGIGAARIPSGRPASRPHS